MGLLDDAKASLDREQDEARRWDAFWNAYPNQRVSRTKRPVVLKPVPAEHAEVVHEVVASLPHRPTPRLWLVKDPDGDLQLFAQDPKPVEAVNARGGKLTGRERRKWLAEQRARNQRLARDGDPVALLSICTYDDHFGIEATRYYANLFLLAGREPAVDQHTYFGSSDGFARSAAQWLRALDPNLDPAQSWW